MFTTLAFILTLALSTTNALPSLLPDSSTPTSLKSLADRATTPQNPDCLPGFSDKTFYATFEAPPNGTYISRLQGVLWSGFQTTTEQYGIIPEDCYYFGPERETRCHYAIAAHARDTDADLLPTLQPASPATKFKLRYFSWAAGPDDYFGPFETMRVLGYNRNANDGLTYSGRFAEFDYTTATAGATGAPMYNVSLPNDFIFAAYRFNITTAGDVEPILLLDDASIVAYTPP